MFILRRIISGGQTGADMGGLKAAIKLGLQTGGNAPKYCKTERGSNWDLKKVYGLIETEVEGYKHRTRLNARDSDGTVIFFKNMDGGSLITKTYAQNYHKPIHVIQVLNLVDPDPDIYKQVSTSFKTWLKTFNISILNVSGSRESKCPGIEIITETFLLDALYQLVPAPLASGDGLVKVGPATEGRFSSKELNIIETELTKLVEIKTTNKYNLNLGKYAK